MTGFAEQELRTQRNEFIRRLRKIAAAGKHRDIEVHIKGEDLVIDASGPVASALQPSLDNAFYHFNKSAVATEFGQEKTTYTIHQAASIPLNTEDIEQRFSDAVRQARGAVAKDNKAANALKAKVVTRVLAARDAGSAGEREL